MSRSTVVAFHGPKAEPLAGLLRDVGRALGGSFTPRPLDDVHATIIGLDRTVAEPDVPGLLQHLADAFDQPLTLRFGGFDDADRRLLSRGRTLAERTLLVQGDMVVLVGWPVMDGAPVPVLGEIRRRCEDFGVRHKYHSADGPLDPDAYLVIGELGEQRPDLLRQVRTAGVLRRPTLIELTRDDLTVVDFVDPMLPRATSRWRPL